MSVGNNWKPVDSVKSIIDADGNVVNVSNALNDGSLKTTLTSLNDGKQQNVKFLSFARVNSDGTTSSATLYDINNVKGTYICTYLFDGQIAQTTLFVGTDNTSDVANSIIFKDPQGNVIGNPFVVTGEPGDTENISSHVPAGYHLFNSSDAIFTLSATQNVFTILVEKDASQPTNNGGKDNNGGNTTPTTPTDNGNNSNGGSTINNGNKTVNNGRATNNSTNGQASNANSENIIGNDVKTSSVKSTDNQNNERKQQPKNDLPDTGQNADGGLLGIIGTIILSIFGLFGLGKLRRKNHIE